MFSGDSLSVILFLAASALAGVMGGLAANEGSAKSWLYSLAAIFTVLTLAWIVSPSVGPVAGAVRPFAVALLRSGAPIIVFSVLFAILTVKGRVAIARPERQSVASKQTPAFATSKNGFGKWTADIKLADVVLYIGRHSIWARGRSSLTVTNVATEISRSLYAGKLHAWAKAHPEDEQWWPVGKECWYSADINPENGYAFFDFVSEAGHDVMLSQGEVEAAYPRAPNS